ncbi:MAG: hypothetical protein ACM3SO_17520 [Betaproteobacteria bacterium]
MRRLLAAVATIATLALPAHAVTFATDASDLWYKSDESGWGVNVIQQADVLFVTFFVYDAAGKPTWYVGSEVTYATTTADGLVYTGKLYQTNGPWFGGPFNASANVREVGTVTFTLNTLTTATITYVADGVSVTKAITRQTWRGNNLAGRYLGAMLGDWSGCPSGNGYVEEPSTITVTQGSNVTIVAVQPSTTCTFTGNYSQAGRLGAIDGTVNCTANAITGIPATSGTFSAREIEGSVVAFSGRAGLQLGACQWRGRIGGLRRDS